KDRVLVPRRVRLHHFSSSVLPKKMPYSSDACQNRAAESILSAFFQGRFIGEEEKKSEYFRLLPQLLVRLGGRQPGIEKFQVQSPDQVARKRPRGFPVIFSGRRRQRDCVVRDLTVRRSRGAQTPRCGRSAAGRRKRGRHKRSRRNRDLT